MVGARQNPTHQRRDATSVAGLRRCVACSVVSFQSELRPRRLFAPSSFQLPFPAGVQAPFISPHTTQGILEEIAVLCSFSCCFNSRQKLHAGLTCIQVFQSFLGPGSGGLLTGRKPAILARSTTKGW